MHLEDHTTQQGSLEAKRHHFYGLIDEVYNPLHKKLHIQLRKNFEGTTDVFHYLVFYFAVALQNYSGYSAVD